MGSPPPSCRPGTALAATEETWAGDTSANPASFSACCGEAAKALAASSLRNRLRM